MQKNIYTSALGTMYFQSC